ncbi:MULTISPECIES: hypothetical protein [Streptomyces]|uniref:hypothetical protein n=1 Tax=Streptomyces TaxID=1883 RepID=UPI0004CD34AB|nr:MULTISPECIES: hypothetical protein [Streptomyces]KOT47126.1 hypothetical protein ADK43_40325 [Streptomyces rimosus subsp. rimosus]
MTMTQPLYVADLASLAFNKVETVVEAQGDEMFVRHRGAFLGFARDAARIALGREAAALLEWQYTGTNNLSDGIEEATASLGEGRSEYLLYRINDDEDSTLELVQPCGACGNDQVNEVRDLAHLGALLEAATGLAKAARGGDER